jgi:hypothetical protein
MAASKPVSRRVIVRKNGHFNFAKTGHYNFALTRNVPPKFKCRSASKVQMSVFQRGFPDFLVIFPGFSNNAAATAEWSSGTLAAIRAISGWQDSQLDRLIQVVTIQLPLSFLARLRFLTQWLNSPMGPRRR